MIATNGKVLNQQTRQVEDFLRNRGFTEVECYQPEGYDLLLRLRVTDGRFKGKGRVERAALVEKELDDLPEDLQAAITTLVLVTQEERTTSPVSMEFDNPSRATE